MLEFLGLLLILASWVSGYSLVSRWYDKDLATISKHAASDKKASRMFAIILMGLGLIFWYWLIEWFTPYLQLGAAFQLLLAVTIFCQIITALVPDTVGWRRKVHLWSAYSMAVLYLPLSVLIIDAEQLTLLPRVVCVMLVIYMLIGFIVVAMMGKAKSRYLFFQASYIVAFQLVILAAAYL